MAAKRGRGARRKGAQFERDIANLLSELVGIEFKRGVGQTRGGGEEIPDVYSDDLEWLHIETKRQVRCNIPAAFRQAVADCEESGKKPVAVTRSDRSPTLVTMDIELFVQLLKEFISTGRAPE